MRYTIYIEEKAKKEIEKHSLLDQRRITKQIDQLTINPVPQTKNFRPLKGFDLYRLRIGDLRLIYSIDFNKKIVVIERVGKRDEKFYKFLK